MTIFNALLVDAYRDLNSRKLFWITLILSVVAVSAMAIVGVTSDGRFRFAFWDTPIPLGPDTDLTVLLKMTYVLFGLGIWLTWAAAILALISTASIIPDFVQSGAIDLVLSKPIGRARLFLIKYLCGLLFVGLQVMAFSATAFVILGVRTGEWEPALFLAVPLVVIFFSYLYCVCALVGLATRSTLAALIATLLFWLALFALNAVDEFLMMPRAINEVYVERLTEQSESIRSSDAAHRESIERQLDRARETLESWRRWHRLVVVIKSAVPKTAETIKLLERSLIDLADLSTDEHDEQLERTMPFLTPEKRHAGVAMNDVVMHMESQYRARSIGWVLGTSLLFEAVMLAISCVVFARRDF